jgi:hypothetical protein
MSIHRRTLSTLARVIAVLGFALVSTASTRLDGPTETRSFTADKLVVCGQPAGEFDPHEYLSFEVPMMAAIECPPGYTSCQLGCCGGVCCDPDRQVCCDAGCKSLCYQGDRCPKCP